MYELNPLNIEAEGTLESQRSTFVDLWDGPGSKTFQQWNLAYAQALGVNWLWFQPIHPYGIDGRHLSAADINAREPGSGATTWRWNAGSPSEDVNYPYALGSPYAVKNFFEVAAMMSKANTRAAAMTEFQDFVAAADTAGISVMLDAAFNHSAWDLEAGDFGVTLGFGASAASEIRDHEARFFSRTDDYHSRAFSAASTAPAPDRFDFGKFLDTKDIYFGRYASLVPNGGDQTRYLSEADWFDTSVATGHFDVLQMRSLYEDRRSAYGKGLVLLNTVSHDEDNYADPWEALLRYAVHSTIDGAPMLFSGQELGLSTLFGFDLMEKYFGKFIPHFKTYNSMVPLWNDTDFGNHQLFHVYAGINAARQSSAALRSTNRYFLSLLGGGVHSEIWSAAKYQTAAASPAFQDVVFAFVNVDRDSDHPANGGEVTTFDVDVDSGAQNLFGIRAGRTYNTKNIAAYTAQDAGRRDAWLWGVSGRSGADLLANGVTVLMKKVPTSVAAWTLAPYEAQYLKLYDVTPPPVSGDPIPEAAYVIGTQLRFDWARVAGADDHVVEYIVDVGTSPGARDVVSGLVVAENSATVTGAIGQTLYASVRAVSSAGIGSNGAASSASMPVVLLDAAGDEDGDGMENGAENSAGTDPLDNLSLFEVIGVERNGGGIEVRFSTIPGKSYQLECSQNLSSWTPVGTPQLAASSEMSLSDASAPEARKFYRASVATE